MQMNRTQSARVGCALSLLVGLVAGVILFVYYQNITSCHADMSPLLRMMMTIDPSQDEQLTEQARQFAFRNGFRFDIGNSDQPSDDFRIRMIRKDVDILINGPFNTREYEVEFYNYDCVHPIVAADLADLVNDFKSFMSEIPNVTITDR